MGKLQDERVSLRSEKVAIALGNILDPSKLPIAVTMEQASKQVVADKFIAFGTKNIPPDTRAHEERRVLSEMTESGLFKAGCEKYARETGYPFVLVTPYFFDHIYADNLREVLDALTEDEVQRSLPAKRYYGRDGSKQIVEEEILGGRHCGAVFFPRDSRSALLLRNEQRRFKHKASFDETFSTVASRVLPEPEAGVLRGQISSTSERIRLEAPKPEYRK